MSTDNAPLQQIGFADILALLWRARWRIAIATLLGFAVAAALSFVVPRKYEASTVLAVVSDTSGGLSARAGGLGSQLGGIAALAGINLGNDSRKAEAVATLQSEVLTQQFLRDKDLLPLLFPKQWDARNKRWLEDEGSRAPTLWKGSEYFRRHVRRVSENAKTGLLTLSITWSDARVAAEWANDLVRRTNDYLRAKTIGETERNIAFLNEQVTRTNIVEIKNASYSLLEAELKRQMMAKGSDEYALKVVDPAFTPEKPSSPMKPVWALSGAFLGLAIACLAIVGKATLGRPAAR